MRIICFGLLLLTAVTSDAAAQLRARVHASGFTQPVAFVQDPSDAAVQFVVEQRGRIRVVRDGTVLPSDFLDLTAVVRSGGEQGLLGLAFPPDAGLTGRFFVNFTECNGDTVVARFRRSPDPLIADRGSRFDLRWNGVPARHSWTSRSRTTTAAISRSVPTGTSTSGWATADPATIRTIVAQDPDVPARQDAAGRRQRGRRASDRLRRARRQPVRRWRRAPARDLELRLAQSLALHVRRPVSRRHRGDGGGGRGSEPLGGSRLRAARPRRAQLRLAQP